MLTENAIESATSSVLFLRHLLEVVEKQIPASATNYQPKQRNEQNPQAK